MAAGGLRTVAEPMTFLMSAVAVVALSFLACHALDAARGRR